MRTDLRPTDGDGRLVTVAVPAYNADQTLADTLRSVCAQTHRALEIVVVDDGSADDTARVAAGTGDPRVRVISTANGGVAAARNVAIAAGRGAFVATIDADDLWHPTKIEKQLAAMDAAGPNCGFVYTFFRRIDMDGRVLHSAAGAAHSGRQFVRSLMNNFVGNGSALLMRRAAFDSVGGYDPGLRAERAQGCEDHLIQTLIALRWDVAVAPEFLTGYRNRPGAMSKDWGQMHRSYLAMLRRVREAAPARYAPALAVAEAVAHARFGAQMLRHGRLVGAAGEIARALAGAPRPAVATLAHEARRRLPRRLRAMARGHDARTDGSAPSRRPRFEDLDPRTTPGTGGRHPLERWIERLSALEGEGDGARTGADAASPAGGAP